MPFKYNFTVGFNEISLRTFFFIAHIFLLFRTFSCHCGEFLAIGESFLDLPFKIFAQTQFFEP